MKKPKSCQASGCGAVSGLSLGCPEGSVDVTCLDSSAVGTCVIQDGALNFWAESEFGGADMKAKLGGYRRHVSSNYCLSF